MPTFDQLRQLLQDLGVDHAQVTIFGGDTFEFYRISPDEYQFYRQGDCPTNYSSEMLAQYGELLLQ